MANSWAAAVTQVPYELAPTIFESIFKLSTHENLPLDTTQALSTHHTLGHSQPFSTGSLAVKRLVQEIFKMVISNI